MGTNWKVEAVLLNLLTSEEAVLFLYVSRYELAELWWYDELTVLQEVWFFYLAAWDDTWWGEQKTGMNFFGGFEAQERKRETAPANMGLKLKEQVVKKNWFIFWLSGC